jgi:hypothetical protein
MLGSIRKWRVSPEEMLKQLRADGFDVGARVRTVQPIDRFPHFVIPAGRFGTITQVDADQISVQMDEFVPGAEEWDNSIMWYPENVPRDAGSFRTDVELVR